MAQSNEQLDDELDREARRLVQRYIDEVVLEFELCPWAAPALRAGRVQTSVIKEQIAQVGELTLAVERATEALMESAKVETAELVLLVFPRCSLGRLEFENVGRAVREALATRQVEGGEVPFALAAFHPEAKPDFTTAERLIPYLRRSPDPLLQAVRTSSLARLEGSKPTGTGFVSPERLLEFLAGPPPPVPLRQRIAVANQTTVERVGVELIEARLLDIHRDRQATYLRLLGPTAQAPFESGT